MKEIEWRRVKKLGYVPAGFDGYIRLEDAENQGKPIIVSLAVPDVYSERTIMVRYAANISSFKFEKELESFGGDLRKWRKKHGLTMQKAAEICGVHFATIRDMEAGNSSGTANTKAKQRIIKAMEKLN